MQGLTKVAKGSIKTADGRLGWAVAAEYKPAAISYYVALLYHPAHCEALGLSPVDALDHAVLSVLGFGVGVVSPWTEPHELVRALRCSQADADALLELILYWFDECPGLDDSAERYVVASDDGLASAGHTLDEARHTVVGLELMGLHGEIYSHRDGREVIP